MLLRLTEPFVEIFFSNNEIFFLLFNFSQICTLYCCGRPTHGYPTANTTFSPSQIKDAIEFTDGLPGTKYDFYLYYSNNSISDWLTWTASITTAPDPPTRSGRSTNKCKIHTQDMILF